MKLERHAGQLAALGHVARLSILRAVVQAGPEGATTTDLQERVDIPWTTLNHHLDRLVDAGLPNKFLVEMVKGRKPGLALDVAMGQGRNALYLASQGWRVTGIDISDEGIRQAREAAAARKLTIEAINANADTWDFGVEKWDLVVMIYAGADENAVKRSLKRGGLVVSEVWHKDFNPRIGAESDTFPTAYKDGFTILRNDVVEDVGDWAWKDRTRGKLVRFAAEKQ